jgi:DNA-binding NtrC family response regulator
MVQAGQFRADLYFRLAVFPVRVPGLREHLEDLPLLAGAWLDRFGEANGLRPRGIAPEALALLEAHPWPGNVRELQNVLEFAALRAGPGEIGPAQLPDELRGITRAPAAGAAPPAPRPRGRAPLEREQILAMLSLTGGNRAEAARRLGVSRVTLWKRLKALGVDGPADR